MNEIMSVCGVPGRLTRGEPLEGGRWKKQEWVSDRREGTVDGKKVLMHAKIRFDDQHGNGSNEFALTGHGWYGYFKARDWDFGGSCHDEIAQVFPELAHLAKWHGKSVKNPMHLTNALYFAGDRDHWGLRKGEKRQLRDGRTGEPVWDLRVDATGCQLKTPLGEGEDITNLPLYRLQDMVTSAESPACAPRLFWEPNWIIGEGKEREFDLARKAAVWPEATDEQLSLPKDELEALLVARLPTLLEQFKQEVTEAGFAWESEVTTC